MNEKQLQLLWESFAKNSGGFTDYNEYKTLMGNPEARKVFYDSYQKDLGFNDYVEFEDLLGLGKQAGVSAQGSTGTSGISNEPTQTTGVIAPPMQQPNGDLSAPSLDTRNSSIVVPQGATLAPDALSYFDPTMASLNEEGVGEVVNILPEATVPMGDPTRVQAPVEDKGVLSDLFNSLSAGAETLNESLASIPEYLYRIAAVPQNLLADAIENNLGDGSAEWLRARYENASTGAYNPLLIASDYAKGARERSEAYRNQVSQLEGDITDNLLEGNFGNAGRQIANSITESIPSIIGMVASSGAGTVGGLGTIGKTALTALPFAAGAYQDISDNPNMSENMKLLASGLKGFSEVVFEQEFGTLPLIEGIINKTVGKDAIRDIAEGYMGRLLANNGIPASAFKGAISEGATTLSQNIIEKYSGENPDKDVWEGVSDAMIVGGVMDAGLSGVSKISDRIIDPKIKEEVSDAEQQIAAMRQDLNNLSSTQAEVLQQAIVAKTEQMNNAIERDQLTSPVLTELQRQDLDDIAKRAEELQSIVDAENVSEDTVKVVQQEISDLQTYRENLINEAFAQGEVDSFITSFQENNPNTTVDLFEDLPNQVIRTFDRVEAGLPTDIVSIDESASWMYNKYNELTELKSNPDRLMTIPQIEGIQEQLAQDIETLENYRYEQIGERTQNQIQPETAVDNVTREEITTIEQQPGGQINEETRISTENIEVPEQAAVENVQVAPVQEQAGTTETMVEAPSATNEIELSRTREGYVGPIVEGLEVIGEGSESTVYRDGDSVIKVSEPYNSDETYNSRVNNINLISDLFGDGSSEVIGFYRSENGTRNPITRQNFVEGRTLTESEVIDYLRGRGVTEVDGRFYLEHNGETYEISDFTDNFIQKENGDIVAIDLGIWKADNINAKPLTNENIQAETSAQENVPETIPQTPVQEGQSNAPVERRTPRKLLEGIVDRLSQTGLANEVIISNSNEILNELNRISTPNFQRSLFNFSFFKPSDFVKTITGSITGLKRDVSENISNEFKRIEDKAKSNGTWLKAPNGKRSNLNRDQWVQVRTSRFKNWFGDWERNPNSSSKILDENGEPKIYYSGSSIGFNEFNKKYFYTGEGAMYYGAGFYFTPNEATASSYSRQSRLGMERADFDSRYLSNIENLELTLEANIPKILNENNSAKTIEVLNNAESQLKSIIRKTEKDKSITSNYLKAASQSAIDRLSDIRRIISSKGVQETGIYNTSSNVRDVMRSFFDILNSQVDNIEAMGVGDGNVFSVYLNARNPLDWEGTVTSALIDRVNKQLASKKRPLVEGVIKTNGDLYKTVAVSLNEPIAPTEDVRQYTRTSEFFNSIGIDSVLHTTSADWNRGYYFNQSSGEQQIIVFEPNQIKSATSNEGTFNSSTADIRFQSIDGLDIKGFYDASTGNIVINEDTAGIDTPIHEFAHAWEQKILNINPSLHMRGMELIKGYEGREYVDYVRETQPSLEGDAIYREALVQAIGDRGAKIISSQKRSSLKEWLNEAWKYIGSLVGISNMTPTQISNLTLNEFADAAAVDLLAGKPFNKLENGDIFMRSEITEADASTPDNKFKLDFMNRMRNKNGMSFQGRIGDLGTLSDSDMKDFVRFVEISLKDGSITSKKDLFDLAKSIGITNTGQIEYAWNFNNKVSETGTGIKKDLVSPERLAEIDYRGLSDQAYIDLGKELVDSGAIDPVNLVQSIISEPRALQPYEVTALIYDRSRIEREFQSLINTPKNEIDSYQYLGLTGAKAIEARTQAIQHALMDFEYVMVATANQQSAAFRLRGLVTDSNYNTVQFLSSMKAQGYVSPELEARLVSLGEELNRVRAELSIKADEADRLQDQLNEKNINAAANRPAKKRVYNSKATRDAISDVLDAIPLDDFGLSSYNFQANNTIRFSINPNEVLRGAVQSAIEGIRDNVRSGRMNVSEALESAVDSINQSVGKGNWDEIKFRSAIVNGMVNKGVPTPVSKPYVNSDGNLVVPGQYLTQLVKNGVNTVDAMVDAINTETNNRFDPYMIRNAVSGYGRSAMPTENEIERTKNRLRRISGLLSKIEDLETKGQAATNPRRKFTLDAEIESLKNQIKTLEYDLEMTPEERAQLAQQRLNANRRKYIDIYTRGLQERIDNKDFAPRNYEAKYVKDAETLAKEAQVERIRNDFNKAKYQHELENKTVPQKLRKLAYEAIFNITRALSAGADLSAIGVQGAIFAAARPRQAAKVFTEAFSISFSEQAYEQYFAEMQADPYYEIARKAGVALQQPNFYESIQEEQYKGNLPDIIWDITIGETARTIAEVTGRDIERAGERANEINPFKIADRNYSVTLSKIRLDLFKEFMLNQETKRGLSKEMDTDQIKMVADAVNTITMASKVPFSEGKVSSNILSAVLFSARKLVSTWKIISPAYAASLAYKNPQLFKDTYGGILGRGLGLMFAMAVLPAAISSLVYDEEEDEEPPYMYNPNVLNPIHSDFLKIRLGNTRISLFQGIDGNIVFASRFITKEYMTSSSQAVRVLGASNEKTRGELGWDYISNKFAPTTAAINTYLLKSDRERLEGADRYKQSFAPMWITGAWEQYEATGNIPESSILGVLAVAGLGYNNYGGAEFAGSKGTDNKKARSIIEKSMISVYTPMSGGRSVWNGEEKAPVEGATYKDVWKPAYDDFMTQATLSSEKNLVTKEHWEKKEGFVAQLKKEGYKYAELKTSGVYMDANFSSFTIDGQDYKLLKSQYPAKIKYIEDYRKRFGERELRYSKKDVQLSARQDKAKYTPEYINMLAEIDVYKKANRYANEMLARDNRRKKINLIKKSDFTSDMDNEDFSDTE